MPIAFLKFKFAFQADYKNVQQTSLVWHVVLKVNKPEDYKIQMGGFMSHFMMASHQIKRIINADITCLESFRKCF